MNKEASVAEKDELSLKWGTLKGWRVHGEACLNLLRKYHELGASSMSAMMQKDTPEQKQIICDLIDAVNCDTIYLNWDDRDISKDEAKKYVMEYGIEK